MDCCGQGLTFVPRHWVWSTTLTPVGAMLAGAVGPRGSTTAAQTAETASAALEVLRKSVSVDVHSHGGKTGITSKSPPNDELANAMRVGSLAIACLADVPDGPILGRSTEGVLAATRTPEPGELYRHHLVYPSQTLKMVPIKFARLGRARGGQNALRIPAQDRPIGHVRQTGDRKRPRAHGVCELVVRWRFRRDPRLAPMRVDIHGNRLTQDFKRGRRGLGRPGGGCRTSRPNSAGEHRAASYSTPTVAARKCVPDHSNPCCSPRECAGQHRLARQTVIEPKPPSASRGGRRRNYTMLVAWPNRRVGSAT